MFSLICFPNFSQFASWKRNQNRYHLKKIIDSEFDIDETIWWIFVNKNFFDEFCIIHKKKRIEFSNKKFKYVYHNVAGFKRIYSKIHKNTLLSDAIIF